MQIVNSIELIGTRLYQWDTDRQVAVIPKDGEAIEKVEFANSGDTETLPVEIKTQTDGTVIADIPPEMLQTGRNIDTYAVMRTANGERTRYHKPLSVNPRPKSPNYVYTPAEVKTYDALEKRVKELEENGGSGGISDEKDPTVPAWAKNKEKPIYNAEEVGAIPTPTTAEVGQVIKVKEIDETGKPIEWEMGEITKDWRYLGKFEVEENVNPFIITKDQNGNDIDEFSEVIFCAKMAFFHNTIKASCSRDITLLVKKNTQYEAADALFALAELSNWNVYKGEKVDDVIENVDFGYPTALYMRKVGNIAHLLVEGCANGFSGSSVRSAVYGNKGVITKNNNKCYGIKLSLGYAENLLLKGSTFEIYVR